MKTKQIQSIKSQISELSRIPDILRRSYAEVEGMKLYRREHTKYHSKMALDYLAFLIEDLWFAMQDLNNELPPEHRIKLSSIARKKP